MSKSDEQLLRETAEGDVGAFALLVDRHKDRVYGLAVRMLGIGEEAEEAAQDAFLRVYRAARKYRYEARVSTYIYRVAVNVCLTRLKRKRKAVITQSDLEQVKDTVDADGPHDRLVRQETSLAIRRAVGMLPQNLGAAVALYHFREMSYDEISEALRVPVGTVKTWLHRGRALLRKTIVESGMAEELGVDGL